MTAVPGSRPLLPVACTLGPDDGAQRLQEWRDVVARAGAGRESHRGQLTLRFRDEPGIGAELERLVAAERNCCAFLEWNVVRDDSGWRVEIHGDDEALRTLSFAS